MALFADEATCRIFGPYLGHDDAQLRDMLLAYLNGVSICKQTCKRLEIFNKMDTRTKKIRLSLASYRKYDSTIDSNIHDTIGGGGIGVARGVLCSMRVIFIYFKHFILFIKLSASTFCGVDKCNLVAILNH